MTEGNPLLQAYSRENLHQLQEAMQQMAEMVRAYHQQLKAAGFTDGDALTLTCAFQTVLLQANGKGKR